MNKDITLEDLGYKKQETLNQLIYKNERQFIDFNKTSKQVNIFLNGTSPYQGFQINDIRVIQAIYNKCKELGWLDE